MFSHSGNNNKEELISRFEKWYNVKFDEQLYWRELHEFNMSNTMPDSVKDAYIDGRLLTSNSVKLSGSMALRIYRVCGRKVAQHVIFWGNSPCMFNVVSGLTYEQSAFLRGIGSRLEDNISEMKDYERNWFLCHPSA